MKTIYDVQQTKMRVLGRWCYAWSSGAMIIPSVTSQLKTSPMESYSMWEHTKRLTTMFSAEPACTFQNGSNTIMLVQSSYYSELTHGKITLLCWFVDNVSKHQYGYKLTNPTVWIGQTQRYTEEKLEPVLNVC
jgi:hypothetical protein